MVIPLVKGWDGIAEIAIPLIMSGSADLFDFGCNINHTLIGDVRLCLLVRKQFTCCLQALSPVFNLASSLGNLLDLLDVGLDGWSFNFSSAAANGLARWRCSLFLDGLAVLFRRDMLSQAATELSRMRC